jgi:RHS repeat-associated protein
MPFGEEIGSGTGGRTTGIGFSGSGDNNRKKFTGYQRDTESALDFAQARYYGNTQGRFTSPDPFSGSATIADPQTFNRYAYCRNNPVTSVDPSGMVPTTGALFSMPTGDGMRNSMSSKDHESWQQVVSDITPKSVEDAIAAANSSASLSSAILMNADGTPLPVGSVEESALGNPQDSQVDVNSLDERTRIFVAVGLGEGTAFQIGSGNIDGYPSLSFDQYPKEQKGASKIHFEGSAALGQLRLECYFMISALIRDVNDGMYKTLEAAAKGEAVGYADGVARLQQLSSPMYNIRARLMIEQLRNVDASGPNDYVHYWRGIIQTDGSQRAHHIGDIRAGNTDFMPTNPRFDTYKALPYWTAKGWKTPGRRQ